MTLIYDFGIILTVWYFFPFFATSLNTKLIISLSNTAVYDFDI